MRYLFNIAYLLLVAIVSPWLIYQSLRTGKYRDGWAAKFLGRVSVEANRNRKRPTIWLHAVSVGEVNLVATMLGSLQQRFPEHAFFITTTTRTGFELAKKQFAEHKLSYAPLDFSWAVKAALDRIQPEMLVLVELELWPNLIGMAAERGVKVAVVNGRLSENSFRGYQRLDRFPLTRGIVSRTLKQVDCVAASNDTYAVRFRALGAPKVAVAGSIKFDGAETDRRNPRTIELARLGRYDEKHQVFLAGSTQDPEESLALATYLELRESHPDLRLIVVPRHPERFDEVAEACAKKCAAAGVQFERRSALDDQRKVEGRMEPADVLLIDTIGELSAWWGVANVAFVGGSMGSRGGQNMIEPSAFGAAVSFGPNTKNFRDVTAALVDGDAAVVVPDGTALTKFVRQCLEDANFAERLGKRSQRLVVAQRGATEKTTSLLAELVASMEGASTTTRSCPDEQARVA